MTWIQTYSGRAFEPLAPVAADVCIHDIGHALAMKCRFNGHCRKFYSVAEHSVRLSRLVDQRFAFEALMHDAAEAYLPDVPTPIKLNIGTWGLEYDRRFDMLEHELAAIIAGCFDLQYPWPNAVHIADKRMLMTEARDLMGKPTKPWRVAAKPFRDPIHPWPPDEAECRFRHRFTALQSERISQLTGGRA